MTSVLFVCTGNICRSPTAEAVFRHVIKGARLDDKIETASAGTHGYHIGDRPDPRAIEKAKTRGISMAGLKAQKVSRHDFECYDYIVAMDRSHLHILKDMQPANSLSKVVLFSDYCSNFQEKDVPDPYYGSEDGFETVLDIIEDGVEGLINALS